MKFTIKKSVFRDVLSKIQGLATRRTNLAITETVLVKTVDLNGITLVATDLETGFKGNFSASVEIEGAIAINAKKLFEIIRDYPKDDVVLREVEKRWIEIGEGNIEYHIVGMNPDDYPEIPQIDDMTFFEVPSNTLKNMIEKTIVIVGATDDKRAHINGIYFERIVEQDKKMIRMVSTDGSRLSKMDYIFETDVDMPEGEGILIPKKGLHEVTKFLDSEQMVNVGFKDNHFVVKKEDETLVIRLLEGEFPKYGDILVKDNCRVIRTERLPFLMMLKRMSILSSESYKGVIFSFESGKVLVTATNPDIGESKEEMSVNYEGDPISIAFNPRFFIDMLNVMDDEMVIIYIRDERRPCLIEGENDKTFLCVIMPMKI